MAFIIIKEATAELQRYMQKNVCVPVWKNGRKYCKRHKCYLFYIYGDFKYPCQVGEDKLVHKFGQKLWNHCIKKMWADGHGKTYQGSR